MRNNKEKTTVKDIANENEALMAELQKIQEIIEAQEESCKQLEKENQKLKMFQSFNSVFNKTQTNKDSVVINQITKELNAIKSKITGEIQEIGKLRKEKLDLTNKISNIDNELLQLRPDSTKKLSRERSLKDFPIRFP
jgi:predicted  nucleic acid-binding Zn-ribbon protein